MTSFPDGDGQTEQDVEPDIWGSLSAATHGTADRRAQLYLISPPLWSDDLDEALTQACSGGLVTAFQLRLKNVDDAEILRAGRRVAPICAAHDVAFIVNDRADLAATLGADGVHLGQQDGSVRDARALLADHVQIGVTCHGSRHLAMEAVEAGADYVAFGACAPSPLKPEAALIDPSLFSWWSALFSVPCVAIGGITPDNARPFVAAGADFLAVSSAVWSHPAGVAAGVAAFAPVLECAARSG